MSYQPELFGAPDLAVSDGGPPPRPLGMEIPFTLGRRYCGVFPIAEPGERWVQCQSAKWADFWASDLGRVARLRAGWRTPQIITGRPDPRGGHLSVRLGARGVKLHQAVADAFHGPRPAGLEVRHFNGIVTDNRSENLAYGTRSQNALDRHAHGTMRNAKLTPAAVEILLITMHMGETDAAAARRLGVGPKIIWNVRVGRTWTWVRADLARRPAKAESFPRALSGPDQWHAPVTLAPALFAAKADSPA